MKIRREQISAFSETADENFIERIIRYLQDKHGNLLIALPQGKFTVNGLPVQELRNLVKYSVGQARSYGLTWETSITSFVLMMFAAAPNFHQHHIVNHVLSDENIEANKRIDKLMETITEANWQAVKESYDAQAWGVIA